MSPRLVALLATLVLSASCATSSDAVERITQAPDRVRESGSARIHLVFEMRISHVGGEMTLTSTSSGVVDFASNRAQLTVDARQEGQAALPTSPCEMVTDGGTAYLRVPDHRRAVADDKPWIRVDLAGGTGVDPNTFTNDPTAAFQYLQAVSSDVEEVGAETVNGTQTVHYRFTVAADRVAQRAPEEQREAMGNYFEQLGITEVPLEVWLDEEGRTSRTSFRMDGDDVASTMTMEMEGFGEPVDIPLPSADEVDDAPDRESGLRICFDQLSAA